MKVAVVGAGIVGLSAARHLASRGHRTTLYERFPLFHARGSSHGRSRIVRRAYPDPFYTAIMAEAYPLWADLETASGRKLLHECGLAYFGPGDAPRIEGVLKALSEHSVPHEVLTPVEAAERCGGLRLEAGDVAIFTPEAGWVAADQALVATYDLAVAAGIEVRAPEAADVPALATEYDAVVVATGGWIRETVDVPVSVNLQTFVYVDAQVPGPVWIDDRNLTYGFPSDEFGQKIGAHLPGPSIDPNREERAPYAPHLEQIVDTVRRHFSNPEPRFREVVTCLYTTTPDEDFRVGKLGENVFYASACSGHGFKMGPWTGRLLADYVEGKDSPERYPRFQDGAAGLTKDD
ncbi:MAG: FAD-dependent oxidoreductase [Fimbriimonas sp.]